MNQNDIYKMVTERIIAQLEKGIIPWERPWNSCGEFAWSRATGKGYSLLNSICLAPGEYATFNQIRKEGGKVLKGSRAYPVIFYKPIAVERKDADGNTIYGSDGIPEKKIVPMIQYFNVFNVETQTTLERKYNKAQAVEHEPIEKAESIIVGYLERSGVKFQERASDSAYYKPSTDTVVVPNKSQFNSIVEYYSTAFHELAHSTGHASRLNRITKQASFGSEEYSKEELIAEITASSIVNSLGLETEHSFRNTTAYIQSWIKALKNDVKMVVQASAKASKSYEMIVGA